MMIAISLSYVAFEPRSTTITDLMQRYLDHVVELPMQEFPSPTLEDIALYLHTSSASSVDNVKCVPITHKSILAGSRSRLAWWKCTWPKQTFDRLRVLGWSPWSHIIGLSHDIGAALLLTRGTYIFGLIPSAYGEAGKVSRQLDVCSQLLETAIEKAPTAFAGVPWVLEGFMRTFQQEGDVKRKQLIQDAIQRLKIFGSGGAATTTACLEFAERFGIPLVIDIGMTEIGGVIFFASFLFALCNDWSGPIFHSTYGGSMGWHEKDCLVADAVLMIIDENGSLSNTGLFRRNSPV